MTEVLPHSGASFDIPAIQRHIDAVFLTLPKDQHGNLILDVNRDRASAALIVRVGEKVEFLGWIDKPWASNWNFGLQGRVRFAFGPPRKFHVWLPRLRGYYRLFRHWNGPWRSLLKAVKARLGYAVRILP